MLLYELSCQKGRLILSVLMLEDAGCNHYAVPGVDHVGSYESRDSADDGQKPSSATLATFCGSVTPSNRRTAAYIALAYLPKRGRGPPAPPCVDQRAQCGGLEGLAQLPTCLTRSRSSV